MLQLLSEAAADTCFRTLQEDLSSYLCSLFILVWLFLPVQVPRVFGPDLASNLGKEMHEEVY